jgi:hypothetical protein
MMHKPRRSSRRRRAQKREGAIMLIVLLIVLTATTLAATSLQSTQYELRAAGYSRAALQTQYVSEAAAMTTLAWIDATAMDRSFLKHLDSWGNSAEPPSMLYFGEPQILAANRAQANRTQWEQQKALANVTTPPLTYTGYNSGSFEDKLGTLGPRSPYVAGMQMENETAVTSNYVVDLYDCRLLSNTAASGYQVNEGGSGTMKYFQYYCVVTSRGRTYVPYPATGKKPTKKWRVRSTSGDVDYVVNRFTMAHDSRGSIITPPMSQ